MDKAIHLKEVLKEHNIEFICHESNGHYEFKKTYIELVDGELKEIVFSAYVILYVRCIKSLNKANKRHGKRSIKQVTSGNVACFYYWKMEVVIMSTNDYIRQSAQKYQWRKYYSVMRPVSIGTHPKNGMMDFINYDT